MYFVSMITSLEKLDDLDLDGVNKIFEEWEKKNTSFDIHIPNLVINAYSKKSQVGEAKIILKRLIQTGKVPTASTWDRMARGYYKNGQMEKAIEMTKKAFLASCPGWKPDLTTVVACLEHLKNKGDTDETQELLTLLDKCGSFPVDFKKRVRRYFNNGRSQA